MNFEWNDAKNKSNFRKHKVWFEEAQTLWSNPHCVEFFDPDHSKLEDRFMRIGHSSNGRVLLVVFYEKTKSQIVRIISARRATPKEAKSYEEGI